MRAASSLLKKSIQDFFSYAKQKCHFCFASFFKRLRVRKMAARPCAAPQAAEKRVFQQPAGFILLFALIQPAFADEPTLEIIPLRHLTVEQAVTLIKPFIEKEGALSGWNNQLVVRTTPENLAQIKKMLQTLDVPPRRLLITVKQDRQIEQADNEISTRGEIRSGDVRVSTGKKGAKPRDGMEIRIIRSDTLGEDKNAQQVQVLEGSAAFIEIGQSVPVAERTVEGGGITDPRLYNSITYRNVTTGFSILPRVNGSTVTLEVAPQRAAPSAQGGGSIDIAQMHTTVSGKLGEWIDIGGAVQEQSSDSSEILSSTRSLRNEDHHVFIKVEEAKPRTQPQSSSVPAPR